MSAKEILENALKAVDNCSTRQPTQDHYEDAIRKALAALRAEEPAPNAGLREAVRDVLEGTPLDRHGNRSDDGMRMHLTMKWDGGTAPVREWFERLDAALRAEEQSHD